MNPKVFVSHATEDKDRFVIQFASRLRTNGIEAWVDQWEINPGDSLVQKIFNEGLKSADAVIVVLSRNSVHKPWIREELDASIVKRIQGSAKIIPVVIDDCEVPEALKATLYQRINDINSYDREFNSIVNAVFGQYDKPPLGSVPAHITAAIDTIPGLTRLDSLALKTICDAAITTGHFLLRPDFVNKTIEGIPFDLDPSEFHESLLILEGKGLVSTESAMSGVIFGFKITSFGFGEYARTYLHDYDGIVRSVALRMINHGEADSGTIAKAINQPLVIVEHVFDVFESKGWLRQIKAMGGGAFAHGIHPEMKRWLREHE